MRIAYCLQVHKNPKQVSRLIRKIYSPNDFFCVVVFGQNSTEEVWESEFKDFRGDNFFTIFAYEHSYGKFGLVNLTLEPMRKLALFDYDYLINLTGQCYPLKSIEEIKNFLKGKTFAYIEEFEMPEDSPKSWGKNGGLERIESSYYRHPIFVLRDILLNKLLRSSKYETKRFMRLPRRKRRLPHGLKPYGGSAFFCLPKKHVGYILRYLEDKPELSDFFRKTFAPDEMFFQTIIMNSPLRDSVINDNLRYIDWTKKTCPAILTMDDSDSLLTSPKLFARKFDIEVEQKILDLIDTHIDNRD